MPEYIEREKLPQEVSADGMSDTAVAFAAGYNTCLEHVKSIPAADVRPVVRGHFGKHTSPFTALCSECGTSMNMHWNFCPNCGADMREANDEKA